jgi:hypothetical protein
MPLKKPIIFIITTTLILVSFSGCIFDGLFQSTTFNLNKWEILDHDGFPGILFNFSTNGKVTLYLNNPNSNQEDYDFFYNDIETILHLDEYKKTVKPGEYQLKVYDKDNNELLTKDFNLNGPSFNILSCSQYWWDYDEVCALIGLKLKVQNLGDVPGYPYSISVTIDNEKHTGLVLPCVIMPGEYDDIYCVLYKKGSPSNNNIDVELLDKDGSLLMSESYNIDKKQVFTTYTYTSGLSSKLVIPYPWFLYDYYSKLPRIYEEDYSVYVFDKYDDYYMDLLVDLLIDTSPLGLIGYNAKSDPEKVNFIASFVQNLEYKKDSERDESYEYPRYPVETLFSYGCGAGDCEDKAILAASILDHLGFNTALLRLSNHMAVGVKFEDTVLQGYSYYSDGYYYLETTTEGKPVGFIPNDYKNPDELTVYSLSDRPYLMHSWINDVVTIYTNTELGDFVKVVAVIENRGNVTANNIIIEGVFYKSKIDNINSASAIVTSLEPWTKKKIIFSVDIPRGYNAEFKTNLYLDGEIIGESKISISIFA